MTHDDIINNLIWTNLKDFPENHVGVLYKQYEVDTPKTYGKTDQEIAREIKEQIYQIEKIDFPKMTHGEIDIIMNRIEGIKNCICVNRKHVNETADSMSAKSLLLEKLSYNIETKVDALIMELEEMIERMEDET